MNKKIDAGSSSIYFFSFLCGKITDSLFERKNGKIKKIYRRVGGTES